MIGHGPAWVYDEDGYCHVCGNGRWKPHHPDCGLADTLDLLQVAEAEMAALKARRCDGCDCFMVADHAETGYGFCLLPNVDYRGAMTGPWGGHCPQVRPDHACNAWRPKP